MNRKEQDYLRMPMNIIISRRVKKKLRINVISKMKEIERWDRGDVHGYAYDTQSIFTTSNLNIISSNPVKWGLDHTHSNLWCENFILSLHLWIRNRGAIQKSMIIYLEQSHRAEGRLVLSFGRPLDIILPLNGNMSKYGNTT